MTIELAVAILALVVAFTAAIFNLAALDAAGQKRLRDLAARLSTRAYRIAGFAFIFVAVVNGLLGIALFGASSDAPTRKDILLLFVFFANIASGFWHFRNIAKKPAEINAPTRPSR